MAKQYGLKSGPKAKRPAASLVPSGGPVPPGLRNAPAGLSEASREAWGALVAAFPDGVLSDLDLPSLRRLFQLLDEREALAGAISEKGHALEKPVQNSQGDVIGTETYAHPLLRELRAVDRAIDQLGEALCLSPRARSRVGLAVSSARQMQAATDALVSRRFVKKESEK